jgi:hypothetical protein
MLNVIMLRVVAPYRPLRQCIVHPLNPKLAAFLTLHVHYLIANLGTFHACLNTPQGMHVIIPR